MIVDNNFLSIGIPSTPDIGPPPKSLSTKPIKIELNGSFWYQVEDILDHRGKPGPMCECLVHWKDFDVSHDSWVRRKFLTPLTLQGNEQFLTEHVRFCEERNKNSRLNMHVQQLKSVRRWLFTFTGDGRWRNGYSYFYIFFKEGHSSTYPLQRYKTLVHLSLFSMYSCRDDYESGRG